MIELLSLKFNVESLKSDKGIDGGGATLYCGGL